jgi:hypothetical protein
MYQIPDRYFNQFLLDTLYLEKNGGDQSLYIPAALDYVEDQWLNPKSGSYP